MLALPFTGLKADIVVIVNKENSSTSLTTEQLVDIYMGRQRYFPNGDLALRIDQDPNSEIRSDFYQKLINKSIAEVNAYWARLLFTGQATPPNVLENTQSILKAVRDNPGAVAYIDSKDVDDTVKVIGNVN
jgi:ABC-type phosphate transport system substrate-binding protein